MRLGTHAASLKAAVTTADRTLWYKPNNIGWDMDKHLQAQDSEIIDDMAQLLQRCIEVTGGERPLHVVIMSNSGFGGFNQKLLSTI